MTFISQGEIKYLEGGTGAKTVSKISFYYSSNVRTMPGGAGGK